MNLKKLLVFIAWITDGSLLVGSLAVFGVTSLVGDLRLPPATGPSKEEIKAQEEAQLLAEREAIVKRLTDKIRSYYPNHVTLQIAEYKPEHLISSPHYHMGYTAFVFGRETSTMDEWALGVDFGWGIFSIASKDDFRYGPPGGVSYWLPVWDD